MEGDCTGHVDRVRDGDGDGDGDGDCVGHVDRAREERLALQQLRMLKKAAREREIRDELEHWRRLQMLATLRDERADLEIEIEVCDVGVAAYGLFPLSDIEGEELAFLRYCIALKNARVHALGLQISEIQLTVRKAAEIVRLHEQRRAEKDALRAEVLRRSEADRLSALNVSAAVAPKGRCPEGGITRSCLELWSSGSQDGGNTCGVKVREESDGAWDQQQQPERQQQPQQPCSQQQQQDQVGPVSACDDRPEEEVEEVESEDEKHEVEEGGREVESEDSVEERAKVVAGGGVCIIGWEAEHGRKRRRRPKRERVKER